MAIFKLENTFLTISVNSFGAELCSVLSTETNIEYIWQANSTIWARHAPHLFPIVGKLKNETYFYEAETYQLPQHGFARDNEFMCTTQTNTQLVFELQQTEKTLKHYPFFFTLQITYTLLNNILTTHYSVNNKTEKDMYFSVGAHPAFNCPLQQIETFEDYELHFPNKDSLIINTLNDGLISTITKHIQLYNNSLPVTKNLFDNDALVCMNTQIEEVSLVSKKTQHGVTLKSYNWPFFGIWTKKQTNQFICLEPWFGIADMENTNQNLNEKTGIIMLEPSEIFTCEFDSTFY